MLLPLPSIIFSQKKKGKKRKPSIKWRGAKIQGRRRNGAVYIPLYFCQPGTYLCSSFLFFLANIYLLLLVNCLFHDTGAREKVPTASVGQWLQIAEVRSGLQTRWEQPAPIFHRGSASRLRVRPRPWPGRRRRRRKGTWRLR